jgi:FkbM family methyltransferase
MKRILGAIKGRTATAWMSRHLFGGLMASTGFVMKGPRLPDVKYRASYAGRPVVVRWRDWPAIREVFIEEEYRIVAACLKGRERPVVLDVGANIGTFSLYVLSLFSKAIVHAYEASASTCAIVRETKKLNPGMDWHVHHAAAWGGDGTVSFETTAFSTGSRVSTEGKESVPARSLSSILSDVMPLSVDLMKVDIEGAEEAFLAGKAEALARVDNLIVELHPGRCNTDAVVETLRQAYPRLYLIPGRASSKPLLLATRQEFTLPLYG